MFKSLFNLFSKDVGLDLGTSHIRVYLKNRGLVFNEPSIVAINKRTAQIVSFGQPVIKMIGKTPPHLQIVKPLVSGIVSDFEVTEKLLRLIFEKIFRQKPGFLIRPRVVVAIPLDVTEVEKKSIEDVIYQAGAREVFLVERPMAAAIGAKLPVHESIGNLIVELGAGLSEIAVISLSGVVTSKSLKIGGETLNKNIMQYLKEKFGILIGEQTAEEIKIKIGSAMPLDKSEELKVKGRDLVTGLPKEIIVNDNQIKEAIIPFVKQITESISNTIEKTPPELVKDIYERGVVLSGGGALLKNLDKFIQKKIDIPVQIVDDPIMSTIRGTGYILEDFENLKEVFIPSTRT
jgi:rod shape-determining protein MreB